MRIFDYEPSEFSHDTFNLAGISTYVYNLKSLDAYINKFNSQSECNMKGGIKPSPLNVNVIYLVHQRTGSHKFTESIAYNILRKFKGKADGPPLICVAFDIRNHGERIVDDANNKSWNQGNHTHALDMISVVDGTLADLKLIIDFLPGYLNLENKVSQAVQKELDETVLFTNILSGYSIGGHVIIRFASKYPELVYAINPVVGCHDLTSLLVNRLFKADVSSPSYHKKWFYYTYEELNLSDSQKATQYPKALHKYLAIQDREIYENFPFKTVRLFAPFGAEDKLVPPVISRSWIEQYLATNSDSVSYEEENVGHDTTENMINGFVTWLENHL